MLLGMLLLQVTAGGGPRLHAPISGPALRLNHCWVMVQRDQASAAAAGSGGWQAPLELGAS